MRSTWPDDAGKFYRKAGVSIIFLHIPGLMEMDQHIRDRIIAPEDLALIRRSCFRAATEEAMIGWRSKMELEKQKPRES